MLWLLVLLPSTAAGLYRLCRLQRREVSRNRIQVRDLWCLECCLLLSQASPSPIALITLSSQPQPASTQVPKSLFKSSRDFLCLRSRDTPVAWLSLKLWVLRFLPQPPPGAKAGWHHLASQGDSTTFLSNSRAFEALPSSQPSPLVAGLLLDLYLAHGLHPAMPALILATAHPTPCFSVLPWRC